MNKPEFKLPTTHQCIVRYVDKNGKMQDELMGTPANNDRLFHTMLMEHKVGYGQIRAVKAFGTSAIQIGNFQRNSFKTVHRDAPAKTERRFEPMFA